MTALSAHLGGMNRQPGPWDLPADPTPPLGEPVAAVPPAGREPRPDPRGGPAFNAPLPAVLLAVSMPALYWFQAGAEDPFGVVLRWGLIPRQVMAGDWVGLFGAMLLHGNWAHVAMNALGALAFGSAVARLFDRRTGVLGFVSFYVVCGLLAGLGYVALHPDSTTPLVGASGAVFGLIGASTRLIGGVLAPALARRSISQLFMWTALNIGIGMAGGLMSGLAGGGGVAWEAHIFGLIAGWLLVGPFAKVFARPSRV